MGRDRGVLAVVLGGTACVTVVVVSLVGLVAPADPDPAGTPTEPCSIADPRRTRALGGTTTTAPCVAAAGTTTTTER
jgi:hypothetical protein